MCRNCVGGHLGVDGQGQEPQHLPTDRARRRGPDQHAAVGVLHQLDETVVTGLVDPAPGRCRAPGTSPHPDLDAPLARAAGSLRPTEPISGSVKVTRGTAR